MGRVPNLDLYERLTAEATAAWPAIASAIPAETTFDPTRVELWRDRAVRFDGVENRLGWDYFGRYDFAMSIGGMALAGRYEGAIADVVREVERRTHASLDEHARWDIIAVIQGHGSIDRRDVREIGHVKVESWNAMPCVVMKIVALHAGPVAIGAT